MLLKVGELAVRTRLTVRTLHHYDAIGLLKPSARSEAGYRLYNADDIARLHAILALRQFKLPLGDIAPLLAADGAELPRIVAQQIAALKEHLVQAGALLDNLQLLQGQLATDTPPPLTGWLAMLARVSAYSAHFSTAELQRLLPAQARFVAPWTALFKEVEAAAVQHVDASSPQAQSLAERWLALMFEWMDGDYGLMTRWGRMYRNDARAYDDQYPSVDMVRFITAAIDLRKAAFLRHLRMDELQQIRPASAAQWEALTITIEQLAQRGESPASVGGKRVLEQWVGATLVPGPQAASILAKMLRAIRSEAVLRSNNDRELEVRQFLGEAIAAHGTSLAFFEPGD